MNKPEKVLRIANEFHQAIILAEKNNFNIYKSASFNKFAAGALGAAAAYLFKLYGGAFMASMAIDSAVDSLKKIKLPDVALRVFHTIPSVIKYINILEDEHFPQPKLAKVNRKVLISWLGSIRQSLAEVYRLSDQLDKDSPDSPGYFGLIDAYDSASEKLKEVLNQGAGKSRIYDILLGAGRNLGEYRAQALAESVGVGFKERGEFLPKEFDVPAIYKFINQDYEQLKKEIDIFSSGVGATYNQLKSELEQEIKLIESRKDYEKSQLSSQYGGQPSQYQEVEPLEPDGKPLRSAFQTKEHGWVVRPQNKLERSQTAFEMEQQKKQQEVARQSQLQEEQRYFGQGRTPISDKMKQILQNSPNDPLAIAIREGRVYTGPDGKKHFVETPGGKFEIRTDINGNNYFVQIPKNKFELKTGPDGKSYFAESPKSIFELEKMFPIMQHSKELPSQQYPNLMDRLKTTPTPSVPSKSTKPTKSNEVTLADLSID